MALVGWIWLLPPAIALTILSWPVGAYHLWSWLWILVTIAVLIDEAIAKFISPELKTISDQMRDYRKAHPVKFWLIMTSLLLFCWDLIVHLAT